MYAEIDLGDSDFIETSFEEEELIYAGGDDLVATHANEERDNSIGAERIRSHSTQETQEEGKLDLWLMLLIDWNRECHQFHQQGRLNRSRCILWKEILRDNGFANCLCHFNITPCAEIPCFSFQFYYIIKIH